jgi:hypothetical protein
MTRPKSVAQYLLNIAVGIDQLGNALLFGDPHSTISARAYVASLKGERWGCVLCGLLSRIQKNHCALSYANQLAADQAAVQAESGEIGNAAP